MSRQARKKSESGFYHVIVRGIGKQLLFEESSDYLRFLETLKRYQADHEIQLHAYCLMENHVHLLLRDTADELDVFMKRLEGSYAFYFNHKYERIGSLFQERFKSEAVDNDAYFTVVVRYILQNPLKAGISSMEEYPWSSYAAYLQETELVHTDFALQLFGGKEALLQYLHENSSDNCADITPSPISDSRAQRIIREQLNLDSGTQLQAFEKPERDRAICILKMNGLSVRQIERLTGINRGVILRA